MTSITLSVLADKPRTEPLSLHNSILFWAIACALDYGLSTITIGGGVAANSGLRQHLQQAAAAKNLRVLFPPLKFCTDNAAMIACAAADHLSRGHVSPLTLGVQSRMELSAVMQLYGDRP